MSKISILIADDHKLIRETWAYILSSDEQFEVLSTCGDAQQAVDLARQLTPDIVLMDINMTPFNGFEATDKIRKASPVSKVIGISMHSQPAYAKKMLQSGARGYVTKNSSREEMVEAIIEVYNGNKYVCDEIKAIQLEQMEEDGQHVPSINSLTEREMQIVNHIREGHSSREIAKRLDISLKTVEVHRHNILKKLKLKNSFALINFINTAVGLS